MTFSSPIQILERVASEPLLGLAIASSVLSLIGSLASRLASRRSAAFRFCIWQMVGLAILASSIILFLLPGVPLSRKYTIENTVHDQPRVAIVSIERQASQTKSPNPSAIEPIDYELASATTPAELAPTSPMESKPRLGASFQVTRVPRFLIAGISVVWLGLMVFHVFVLAWSFQRAFSLAASHSELASEQMNTAMTQARRRLNLPSDQNVRLVVSSVATTPLTVGIFRPTIVLPICCGEWTPSKLEMVLLHELAHVERRDVLWHSVIRLACCVAWFNPLVWRTAKNAVSERERACDDRVLSSGIVAISYGQSLVEIASAMNGRSLAFSGVVSMAEPPLQVRLRSILDPSIFREPIRKRTWIAIATLFIASSFALGIIRPLASPVAAESETNGSSADVSLDTIAAAEGEDGVVTGILVRATDGSPVADATVTLYTGGSSKTTSDSQGSFRFENVEPSSQNYSLWANLGNLVGNAVDVKSAKTADPKIAKFAPLRIEMQEGHKAKFLVSSADTNLPLEGAKVRIGYPYRRSETTDINGIALVEGLMPHWESEGGYSVRIEAAGHARSAMQFSPNLADLVTEINVTLPSGGIVRGQVVDAEGQPLADVGISYRLADSPTGFYGDTPNTVADGNFQNRFLPLNTEIKVSAGKNGYLSEQTSVLLSEKMREADMQFTLRTLPEGWSIAGTVVDEHGKPIADATVTTHWSKLNGVDDSKTDNAGQFLLQHVRGDRDTICLTAKGFSPELVQVTPNSANTPVEVSIVMKPGRSIRGQIKLENGQPAVGAAIDARSSSFRFFMSEFSTADRDGFFRLDSLSEDALLSVSLKGYARLDDIRANSFDGRPVNITLESPGIIRGLVMNAETQQPVPQCMVRLGFAKDRQPSDAKGTFPSWSDSGVKFSSEDGRFIAKPLTHGMAFEMIVEADGYERLAIPRVVASKADAAQEVVISLKPKTAMDPYKLTVQLQDDSGKPIPNIQLRLIVSTQQPTGRNDRAFNWALIDSGNLERHSHVDQFLSGATDSDGRFEFGNVHPDRYLQLAYWGKGVAKERSLAFDESRSGKSDEVIVDVPQPALVRGTVDRSVFPDASLVHISSKELGDFRKPRAELLGDQSTFELRDLPVGKFWISVAGKRVTRMENGIEMSGSPNLASKELVLNAGDVTVVHFDTPDTPR
jgi:beta-lactamase regulating signal transducer with metallopeptidase domain